jgi:hypothetical protein
MCGAMNKTHKRALRFAYDLLRGEYRGLPYIRASIPIDLRLSPGQDAVDLARMPWIEPDQDPERPYLNEAVFTELALRGWMECAAFPNFGLSISLRAEPALRVNGHGHNDRVWLYRITPVGCAVMGWDWPTHSPYRSLARRPESAQWIDPLRPPYERQRPNRLDRRHTFDPHRFRRSSDWRRR